MEATRSSETAVLTRATLRNIPEDGVLLGHRNENLKSYIALTSWTLQRGLTDGSTLQMLCRLMCHD
jgi:hypothetical protein